VCFRSIAANAAISISARILLLVFGLVNDQAKDVKRAYLQRFPAILARRKKDGFDPVS